MFINCSTCFGRRTAHHQELKNYNCSLWFYTRFCLPAAAMAQPSQRPATKNVCKTEAAITVFELLMMSGLSLETCSAIKKQWNNKFYYTVASCSLFLYHLNEPLNSTELRFQHADVMSSDASNKSSNVVFMSLTCFSPERLR